MDGTDITRPSDSEEMWLNAAYQVLTESGVEAVKIMPLAKRLGVTRTSFYWHFSDRDALLEAMVRHWEDKNTGNLVARCEAYAEDIDEAIFNLFDCWLDDALFDSPLDLAIRNWARNAPALQARINQADRRRVAAIEGMFQRFGYDRAEAEIRALTMYYTQIGYISMQVTETREHRLSRILGYLAVFSGKTPGMAAIQRFQARHGTDLLAPVGEVDHRPFHVGA